MDRFREMTVFVRVVDAGNFSAASRSLLMCPSAVNKQITKLEDRLGIQLFHRSTRGIRPTDAGAAYYSEASRIIREVTSVERRISRTHELPAATFRISSTVAIARRLIVPVLAEFQADNPRVKVELTTTNALVDLLESNVDIAVRAAHLESSSLIARKLASDVRLIAASPAYLATHGTPQKPEDLREHNCLTMPKNPTMSEWAFKGPDGPYRIAVSSDFASDTSDTLLQAACDGVGLVRLSMFMLGPEIKSGRLVPVLADHIYQEDTGLYAVYLRSRHPSPLIRSFIDLIARTVQTLV